MHPPPPSTEEVDMQEVKYFRFPSFKDSSLKINNIENASIENRKRLRAHMYIGNETDKERIVELIQRGISWIKDLYNPPIPQTPTKHGSIEADSVYIYVYREDKRREKSLLPKNTNFVCMVDYNIDGITTIKHGGVPQRIWDSYYHEKRNKTTIAWGSKEYAPPKIGRNDDCPCGSGKKNKYCCGK